MKSKRLYIIGNGFDLYHKIKSSYWDFETFVKTKDKNLFEALGKYFNANELWSDFETTLEYLDTERIIDEATNYLESYGSEKWSEASHYDYQFEIKNKIDLITIKLKEKFIEWVLQLAIPIDEVQRLNISSKAFFLTFNYTCTLERVYRIPPENILYIHNKISDKNKSTFLMRSLNDAMLSRKNK